MYKFNALLSLSLAPCCFLSLVISALAVSFIPLLVTRGPLSSRKRASTESRPALFSHERERERECIHPRLLPEKLLDTIDTLSFRFVNIDNVTYVHYTLGISHLYTGGLTNNNIICLLILVIVRYNFQLISGEITGVFHMVGFHRQRGKRYNGAFRNQIYRGAKCEMYFRAVNSPKPSPEIGAPMLSTFRRSAASPASPARVAYISFVKRDRATRSLLLFFFFVSVTASRGHALIAPNSRRHTRREARQHSSVRVCWQAAA